MMAQGEVEAWLYLFLKLTLDGVDGHGNALATLPQERVLVQESNLKCTLLFIFPCS
jgi:hypothetical protein